MILYWQLNSNDFIYTRTLFPISQLLSPFPTSCFTYIFLYVYKYHNKFVSSLTPAETVQHNYTSYIMLTPTQCLIPIATYYIE